MTTNFVADIAAAEARLAAAKAEVADLRRKRADELDDVKSTEATSDAEAGRQEARRRIAQRAGTATAAGSGDAEASAPVAPQEDHGAAAGKAEAQRRLAQRRTGLAR